MKSPIIINANKIIQVRNPVLVSNLLELKAIEKYHQRHPNKTLNEAATEWIDQNAASWRAKHPNTLLKELQ
jgi:hypothetical protein